MLWLDKRAQHLVQPGWWCVDPVQATSLRQAHDRPAGPCRLCLRRI